MLKRIAKFAAKLFLAHLIFDFFYGVQLGARYQMKHGAGTKPTTQEIADHYFGIKKCV